MEKKYLNDSGLMHFWGKIKSYTKSVSDALQGQINDKQQQITANKSAQDAKNASLDENMTKLNTRDDQITETLKNISATGGASVASAVTYDNTTSQLTSANIQGAVDELQGAKIDKTSILQESGESTDKVMSQKAVSDKLSDLSEEANINNNNIHNIHREANINNNNIVEGKEYTFTGEAKRNSIKYSFEANQVYIITRISGYSGFFTSLYLSKDGSTSEESKVQTIDTKFSSEDTITFTCNEDAEGIFGWWNPNGTTTIKISKKGNLESKLSKRIDDIAPTPYVFDAEDAFRNIIGSWIPLKATVFLKNIYISSKGVKVRNDNFNVTKAVMLHRGERVTLQYNDINFAAISTYDAVSDTFTPICIYPKRNAVIEYIVEEDIEAYFTVQKSECTIRISNSNDMTRNISDLENKVKNIILSKTITIQSKQIQTFELNCNIPQETLVFLKLQNSKINSVVIKFLDEANEIITQTSNLNMFQFPYKVILKKQCVKIQLAIWNVDWIDSLGDMQFIVKQDKGYSLSIKDSLQLDRLESGLTSANCNIVLDGKSSFRNYGKDGAVYEFNIDNDFSMLYIYFEWQAIKAIENNNIPLVVAKLFNGALRNYYGIGNMLMTKAGNICRSLTYGNSEEGDDTLKSFEIPSGFDTYDFADAYFSFTGKDAIWVRYTGSASDTASIKIKEEGVVIKINGIISSYNFDANTPLSTVVNTLSAIDNIEAGIYMCGNKVYGDLLKNNESEFTLIQSYTTLNKEEVTTNPRKYLPLAYDDEWHSCEILVNIPNRQMIVNHDGFTTNSIIDESILPILELERSTISIGDYYNGGNCAVRFRNLDLQIDSNGGAEYINYNWNVPNSDGSTWKKYLLQMISPHNPKILLYEGHGVIVGKDNDVPSDKIGFVTEEGMSCTTDRLMNIFAYAKSKGYEFVTWNEILDWKIKGKTLPKRCLCVMFDDWRIDIFLNYYKRYPFVVYGVKPALALITKEDRNLDETVSEEGLTCTIREGLQMIKDAGWYLCSHSYNHREHTNMTFDARVEALKKDDILARKYGVSMDLYTYPGSNYQYEEDASMKSAPIMCGIGGDVPDYICKGSNRFNLTRTDIGLRVPYNDILKTIV